MGEKVGDRAGGIVEIKQIYANGMGVYFKRMVQFVSIYGHGPFSIESPHTHCACVPPLTFLPM